MYLYDLIGNTYDSTRRADPDLVQRLIRHLNIQPSGNYLDVACGTGNYTMAIANYGVSLHGLDQSRQMVATASEKASSVTWHLGNAEALPFPDGMFSGALCTLAIHHFRAIRPVFQEVFRVLDGGHFVIFTATPEQMRGYWLNEYFPRAMDRSIQQMPSLEVVVKNLQSVGFGSIHTEPYEVSDSLQDLFLYSGKHRPALYLDPRIRASISTFAALAEPDEVECGCAQLSQDIQSGRIIDVTNAYRHDGGDYIFIVADKKHNLVLP